MAYIPFNSGQFNAVTPLPSDGQVVALQLDNQANLKVDESGSTVPELLRAILSEVRTQRKMLALFAEETGQARADDFDPNKDQYMFDQPLLETTGGN